MHVCHSCRHSCVQPAKLSRRHLVLRVQAGKGFAPDQTSLKSKGKKERRNWTEIARLDDFPADRSSKPFTLASNNVVMLHRFEDQYFCSAPNSTAYQYPLTHARIHERAGKPAIEVPLDGTVYDLQTGRVLEWCPKNNPVRFVLGTLKAQASKDPLEVFPVLVEDGVIYAKFS